MKREDVPKPGTPIWVYWEDITEDPIGDPTKAKADKRRTLGVVVKTFKRRGREYLVTTTTEEGKNNVISEYSGWSVYPLCVVTKIRVLP